MYVSRVLRNIKLFFSHKNLNLQRKQLYPRNLDQRDQIILLENHYSDNHTYYWRHNEF